MCTSERGIIELFEINALAATNHFEVHSDPRLIRAMVPNPRSRAPDKACEGRNILLHPGQGDSSLNSEPSNTMTSRGSELISDARLNVLRLQAKRASLGNSPSALS